jgi:hypothetical protein
VADCGVVLGAACPVNDPAVPQCVECAPQGAPTTATTAQRQLLKVVYILVPMQWLSSDLSPTTAKYTWGWAHRPCRCRAPPAAAPCGCPAQCGPSTPPAPASEHPAQSGVGDAG